MSRPKIESPRDTPKKKSIDMEDRSTWVVALIAVLLIAFGVTAWSAVRGKSATYDEPMHSMGAYVLSQYHDFRINPEDPPLWQWWASLALSRDQLKLDRNHPLYKTTLGVQAARWPWVFGMLYLRPENDPIALVMRVRTMLIPFGMVLGLVIAWWSWRLAGKMAAIGATAMFALDPNFLAHTAVVKNDVAITLVGTALALATWFAGRRLTRLSAASVVLLGSAAVVTKFSGPLLLVALAITLTLRALMPGAWKVGGRDIHSRAGKCTVALTLLALTGIAAFFSIWACYLFRYSPTRDGLEWDFAEMVRNAQINETLASHPERLDASSDELAWRASHPRFILRALTFLDDHHIVPQTWSYGMLYVYRSSLVRASYLLGESSVVGFRWYFPLAFVWKTPLATLAMFAIGIVVGAASLLRWIKRPKDHAETRPALWSIACIAIPVIVLGYTDLRANLNIGLRHILPLYPFFFVAGGCAVAYVWRHWGRNGRVLLAGLAVALLIETGFAYPDYIAFFNRAAGGERGGLDKLGDSNLDWGQDLPLLAQWQKKHSDRKLYLLYFGQADPSYYGIKYSALPGASTMRADIPPMVRMPTEPGVIAISATFLQGIYLTKELKRTYGLLRSQEPLDVLGGTIYLYEYSP